MIVKRFIEGPVMTNMYVVSDDNREGFIVDCAYPSRAVEEYINKNNIEIKFILQTHTHFDHVLGLEHFKNLYKVKAYASEDSLNIANDKDYNLAYSYDLKVDIDEFLKDGEVFSEYNIKAIKTPGHTIDSMSFKIDDMIFSGDTLFKLSIGRTDFPGGSYPQIIDSIKNKLGGFDKDTIVYPGHGDETYIGYELNNNPFLA